MLFKLCFLALLKFFLNLSLKRKDICFEEEAILTPVLSHMMYVKDTVEFVGGFKLIFILIVIGVMMLLTTKKILLKLSPPILTRDFG